MYNFAIIILENQEYDCLLIFHDYEGFLASLNKLEKKLKKYLKTKHYAYKVIIDLVFVTGNSDNRFLSCYYLNGKFDFSLTKNVVPGVGIRQLVSNWLCDHYKYVENSALSTKIRNCIKNRTPF